jgi:NADH:ubiquinone oxidoreductase subunit 2 (subunit N)
MISLGYYLPVIATMWMCEGGEEEQAPAGPPAPAAPGGLPVLAGGSAELDDGGPARTSGLQLEVLLVAVLGGAATMFFGIVPQPLFDLVHHAGGALGGLF